MKGGESWTSPMGHTPQRGGWTSWTAWGAAGRCTVPVLRSWVGFKAEAKPHSSLVWVFIQNESCLCCLKMLMPPPSASILHINNTTLSPPPKGWVYPGSALLMLPDTPLLVKAWVPQLHRGSSPSSILIFDPHCLWGCF